MFRRIPHSAARHAEEILYNFRGSNGENPNGGVTLDKTGSLYGTTGGGVVRDDGVVVFFGRDGHGHIGGCDWRREERCAWRFEK